MQRLKKSKVKTVADKVSELIAKSNGLQSSDESEDEAPKIAEFDDEEYALPDGRSTDIRKRNIKLLSEQSAKYRGKITSRKDLEMDDDSESEDAEEESYEESSDDDEEALKAFGDKLKNGHSQVLMKNGGKRGYEQSDSEDNGFIENGAESSDENEEMDDEESEDDDDDEEALKAFGQGLQVNIFSTAFIVFVHSPL